MTKFKTVKRKANVGERILITDASITGGEYGNGDVLTVVRHCDIIGNLIYAKGSGQPIHTDEYEIIEDKSDADRRLTEAESKIAALEAEVKALKDAGKPKEYRGICLQTEIAKTPNQRRADVIKRAQAFVADLEKRAVSSEPNTNGNDTFKQLRTDLSFHVNSEKGVVTALAHGRCPTAVVRKAFAKCAPGDVFNADIGKAIAAGYLYGVEVPKEFTDAVKPTEVVVGMVVRHKDTNITVKPPGQYNYAVTGDCAIDSPIVRLRNPIIIDDSEAVYE